MNLHNKLYNRFWLSFDLDKAQNWFKKYIKNLFNDSKNWLFVIIKPSNYKETKELNEIKFRVLKESCRQLFLDYSDFSFYISSESEFTNLVEKITNYKNFNEYIFSLQIILDLIYKEKLIKVEYYNFINSINEYLKDFPEIWILLKIYKTKSAQFFPSNLSKVLEKNIENSLWLLENIKFNNTLNAYEEGLKLFLSAKNYSDFKNIIEDLLWTLDEFVKEFTWQNNKWFKHIFKEWEYQKFWLNNQNKEIYRTLRDYMDSIKHWSIKDITKGDIEMSLNLTATFIVYVINKTNLK